jgi:predicted MPP superfamily phosphohydrolase
MSSKTLNIIHFSDLHFGRIHDLVLADLEKYLSDNRDKLSIVILTGDLTQRAKKEQFIAAKNFLEKIKTPIFVVPGNHDVPLYNLFLRFFTPYSRFRKYMGNLISNYFENEDVAIFGLWTVNPYKIEEGKITEADILAVTEKFKAVPSNKIKILAGHHPIATYEEPKIKKLFEKLIALKPDFMMWGHDHQSSIKHFDEAKKTLPIMLASGTTVSSRVRVEANSFNLITINGCDVQIKTMVHSKEKKGFYPEKEFIGTLKKD